ncbi:MAG: hypothetical protein M3Y72_12415 [Acidobacteriota bacterium]|nr:hypothetical protein [Acidobacteriota bacterium]
MTNPNLEHPTEEALERYLLQRTDEQELESLETHVLACESCITRLEILEPEIATLKITLVDYEEARIQNELNPSRSSWKDWFTIPRLSWAGAAVAALGIGLTVVPHSMQRLSSAHSVQVAEGDLAGCQPNGTDMTLTACRGTETATLPGGHPLHLRLDATDIQQGHVDVQVVNGTGNQVWQGQTTVSNERAEVNMPEISQPGSYFLRFYAPSANSERELLREFRFEVK